MNVVVIIVNYFAEHFLPGLLNVLDKEECIHQIIIADNGSTGKPEELTAYYSNVRVKKFNGNIGFGAAVNFTAKELPADYYLVINPDTLPESGFAGHLLETARKTGALLTGPRFYWDNEKTFRLPPALGYSLKIHSDMQIVQSGSPIASVVGDEWVRRHERFWNADEPFAEPFLSGSCLLVKNDMTFFTDGKIFDERFFLYFEDTDLCLRACVKNKTILVNPKAKVVHYWDQSPSLEKEKLMEESRNAFLLKHYGPIPELPIPEKPAPIKPETRDLGLINPNTVFSVEISNKSLKLFYEIGLNEHFIPFAQAELSTESFRIPQSVFSRLRSGEYYSRIRNTNNQTLKTWRWTKP
jgi:GT2 family glycosyltransferase